ncbi:MAG TPA: hypothetical protein VD766_11920, partial [Solirubrobacterales bacterium]|nr:hypothetical protein [Solirubrobacterales bacterium]
MAEQIETADSTGDLAFSVECTSEASVEARTALLSLSASLSAERFSDLRLIVTELVENGVAHGPGGRIQVRVEIRSDGSVRGVVT